MNVCYLVDCWDARKRRNEDARPTTTTSLFCQIRFFCWPPLPPPPLFKTPPPPPPSLSPGNLSIWARGPKKNGKEKTRTYFGDEMKYPIFKLFFFLIQKTTKRAWTIELKIYATFAFLWDTATQHFPFQISDKQRWGRKKKSFFPPRCTFTNPFSTFLPGSRSMSTSFFFFSLPRCLLASDGRSEESSKKRVLKT